MGKLPKSHPKMLLKRIEALEARIAELEKWNYSDSRRLGPVEAGPIMDGPDISVFSEIAKKFKRNDDD